MTTLTDLQSLLLAAAASRDSGSLVPLPASIKAPAAGVAKSLGSLVTKGLAEEREVTDAALVHHSDGDVLYGLFITAAGKQAIGVEDESGSESVAVPQAGADPARVDAAEPTAKPARETRAAAVLELLGRAEGATLPELIAATGWLPHTTRAALTGLRKKGHVLDKSKRDGADLLPHRGDRVMEVEAEIAVLEDLTSAQLRERWAKVTGSPVPRVSPSLLRLALAWELQAKAHGGLSREVTRALDQHGRGLTRTTPARSGMRLVREWNGRTHVVTVGDDQLIHWEERSYGSLSEVARAITGTRWSGPAFFGLKRKAA